MAQGKFEGEASMQHCTQLAAACNDADQKKLFREPVAMERDHKAEIEQAFMDTGFPEIW